MNADFVYLVVQKLIGNICPIGATHTDNNRFDNLKELCKLVDKLVYDIDHITTYKDSQMYSIKRAGEYADNFLTQLGITE